MPSSFLAEKSKRIALDAADKSTKPVRCAVGVELVESGVGDGPKWVQIAYAGEFNGYLDGGNVRSFEFTRETFENIVRNLHRNPSYRAGSEGVGDERVIPWDFQHASEHSPTSGSVPSEGAPAQGWTYDLQIREGQNGAELWALTEFLEPAKSYVKEKKYRWASVSVYFDVLDQATGENIGTVLSSIALTNTPFLAGMAELAADRKGKARVDGSMGWYEAAKGPAEALDLIKDRLGLPQTATLSDVNVEIAKLQNWLSADAVPLGVNIDAISEDLRKILNLPALTPITEVFRSASQAMVGLLDEQALGTENNGATETAQVVASAEEGGSNGGETMDEFLKKLAGLLGVNATEGEVTEAVNDAIDLRKRTASAVKATKSRNDDIVSAAEEAAVGNDGFRALIKALGAKDLSDAVEAITVLLNKAKELDELKPQFEELQVAAEKAEDEKIAEEVELALLRFDEDQRDNLREALTLQRKSDPKGFGEKFPPVSDENRALTRSVAVTPTGQQLSIVNGKKVDDKQSVDLGLFEGRNPTERAKAYVRAHEDQFGKIESEDHLRKIACQLKNNEVPGQPHFFDSRAPGGAGR